MSVDPYRPGNSDRLDPPDIWPHVGYDPRHTDAPARRPSGLPRVLGIGCVIVIALSLVIAFFGYWGWGAFVRFGIELDLDEYATAAQNSSDLPDDVRNAFLDTVDGLLDVNQTHRIGFLQWLTASETCDPLAASGSFTVEGLERCHARLQRLLDRY